MGKDYLSGCECLRAWGWEDRMRCKNKDRRRLWGSRVERVTAQEAWGGHQRVAEPGLGHRLLRVGWERAREKGKCWNRVAEKGPGV